MKRNRLKAYLPLACILALGLVFRMLVWGRIPRTGFISDEGEYLAAATWLAEGRGFSWYQGYLWTRAPLYPLFLAAHFRLFGQRLEPVYITQTLLSLVNVALVYALARRMPNVGRRMAVCAALFMACYLPFAIYPQVLLSETVYLTLLLGGFFVLSGPRLFTLRPFPWRLVLAGMLFGMATLTRSLTLAFLPIVALWLVFARRTTGNEWPITSNVRLSSFIFRLSSTWRELAIFTIAAALVVLPWTAYNSTRVYGGLVVVDTTGAYNLAFGARTAYDGKRSDAPTRNFALALLGQLNEQDRRVYLKTTLDNGGACQKEKLQTRVAQGTSASQAELQRWLTSEGFCLIGMRPWAFVQKTAGELLDFFQINYSGDERFTDAFTTGRLPRWYTLALFLLDDTLYVLVLPLAAVGWAMAWRSGSNGPPTTNDGRPTRFLLLVLLWWLFNIAVAPVLFAINRFRLPLLPFAFIFAAYALVALPQTQARWWRTRGGMVAAAVAFTLLLVAATPYAYFEPPEPDGASHWASYMGRFPSSVDSTGRALAARSDYVQQEQMRVALRNGDAAAVRELRPATIRLPRAGKRLVSDEQIIAALLAAVEGRPSDGLALLPESDAIIAAKDVEAAVVRADLLRTLGRDAEANMLLTPQPVDDANPVQWAFDWLHPAPTTHINIGGNLDIGYITGCYLGEGVRDGNYRWCTDGAQIRFPDAGTGSNQTLVLRVDGRGWNGFAALPPSVRVLVGSTEAGQFTQNLAGPQELSVTLPPTPKGEDVVVTLRTPTFVPKAEDFNRQQGKLAGQGRRLGVQLDWVELKG